MIILSGISIFMKTAIITGASSGIGYATAIKLKSEGYNVVGSYLSNENSAKQLEKEYGIPCLKCDVSIDGDVNALFDYAEKRYGKPSLVIANAGVALKQKLLVDVSASDIQKVVNVNLLGTLLTNKRAVSSMLDKGGRIINVSSIFGLSGGSCEVAYSATKAGILGITEALSEELSFSQIEVLSLVLGLIDTPMNAHLSDADKLEFVASCGLNSVPTASDVASEIYKIATDKSNLNGKTIKLFAGK